MQKFHFVTFFCGLVICCLAIIACADDELAGNTQVSGVPIVFATGIQNEEYAAMSNSRASRASEVPLMHNFVLYGYKGAAPQIVFDGYTLSYHENSAGTSAENTHDYSYVDPAHGQFIKFWDFGVAGYNFWGYTGAKSCFGPGGTTLTIPGLEQTIAEPDLSGRLFSSLYHRSPVSSDVVQLQFRRPMAQVSVLLYSGETLETGDVVQLGESTFGPASPTEIITKGQLVVNYPASGAGPETYATTPTARGTALSFASLTLDSTHGNSSAHAVTATPKGGTAGENLCYYVVPNDYNVPFVLTTTVDDDAKTAVVPGAMMRWRPGYVYTYIFKITEAGKKIEFYDVKVDPWKYGGSQDDEWKNW